ncbi:MAG: hypothetical protein ACFFBP_11550 [Promethearchaeota archaeon]
MPCSRKNKSIAIFIFFLLILCLILFSNVRISYALDSSDSLIVDLNFLTHEFSDKKETMNNVSAINIELPSSTWNITQLEINFTNIEYYSRELKTIEDYPNSDEFFVDKQNTEGIGVQISINEITTIYGAYLNLKILDIHMHDELYVRIRGYDSSINAPNNTIYGEVTLNNTIIDGWNYQNFSSSIRLPKGNYFLVLEGFIQAEGKYHWYCNDLNPNNPNLYISKKSGSGWSNGIQNSPFLYKLDQEIKKNNATPEEFNMTAEINEASYNILNGPYNGSGTLNLKAINFSPQEEIFHINVKPNKFFFNLSYYIKLKNQFYSNGFVNITENQDNLWKIIPDINRCNYNYSVKIKLPNNYYDLMVLKDSVDITLSESILNDGYFLYILNDTIDNDVNWEIMVKSPQIDLTLDLSRGTEFELGKELIFSAIAPIREGNFTFIVYNELGAELERTIIPVVLDETIYSFNIEPTASLGVWSVYIYWNNYYEASVKSQEFTIIPPSSGSSSPLDLNPILIIIIALILISGTISVTGYQTIKRKKRGRDLKIKKISNKFKDILSLNYLMISDIRSGVNLFEQFYMGKSMEPSLISGFLDAIKNFGIELTGSYRKTETLTLDYEDSIILMNECSNFRLIIITSDKPSEELTNSITNLANEIEEKYGDQIQKFSGGLITQFRGIKELIEKHLNVSFASPLKIIQSTKIKLDAREKVIIERAKEIMKQTNLNYFYTTFLMPDQQFDLGTTKTIFNLIEKNIFKPINLNFKE